MIGVEDPQGRLRAVWDRGMYTGKWTIEEQNGQIRMVLA